MGRTHFTSLETRVSLKGLSNRSQMHWTVPKRRRALTHTNWSVYVVDFDYMGEANKDRNPPITPLNETIGWPDGVRPAALMQTVHDDRILTLRYLDFWRCLVWR